VQPTHRDERGLANVGTPHLLDVPRYQPLPALPTSQRLEERFNALRQFAREGALNHRQSARILDARWKKSATHTKIPTPAEQHIASHRRDAKRTHNGHTGGQDHHASKRRATGE
jgi:hypothetical protein